jgi:hypothetical protein
VKKRFQSLPFKFNLHRYSAVNIPHLVTGVIMACKGRVVVGAVQLLNPV